MSDQNQQEQKSTSSSSIFLTLPSQSTSTWILSCPPTQIIQNLYQNDKLASSSSSQQFNETKCYIYQVINSNEQGQEINQEVVKYTIKYCEEK